MVEAEEVQDAVGGEEQELLQRRVASRFGLGFGDLRAQNDVAEEPRRSRSVFGSWTQFVHREAQHVGRARFVHPLHVKLFHGRFVDEDDVEVGLLAHVHGPQCEVGEAEQGCFVDGDG
jgi:hypothetical protein